MRRRRGAVCRAVLASLLALLCGGAGAAPRLVSINLCTDQLLLALADPGQILGLSPYARDPAQSWAAVAARKFPALSGSAEEVLVLRPDVILSGRYTAQATRAVLRAEGLRVVEFDVASTIAEVEAQIAEVARLVGHEDRGAAAIAGIADALARARRAVAARGDARRLSVLPLQRRGWVAGGETLTSALLAAVGLAQAGAAASGPAGGQVALETILALRPDRLLVSHASLAEDQGSAMLEHPALRRLYPPERRILLPERLTVCGGPMLVEAIDGLLGALARDP